MEKDFFVVINNCANLLLLVVFIYITFLSIKNKNILLLKLMSVYTGIAIVINLLNELNYYKIIEVKIIYGWIFFSFIHLGILLWVIEQEISKVLKLLKIKFFFWVSILVQFLFCLFDLVKKTYYSATFSNLIIIGFSILFYFILFKGSVLINLKNHVGFILINGIFLSTCLILPIILFGKHIKVSMNSSDYFLVASIGPFASILLYSFFLKTAACIRKSII